MNAQDFIVFVLVAGAAAYLVRNWWGASKKSGGGCSGCAGACGKPQAKAEPQLVQISLGGSSLNGSAPRSAVTFPAPRPKS